MQAARRAGHEVTGSYATHPVPELLHLRLDDTADVRQLMSSTRPDAVVCCAAWSWVDGCESDPSRAFSENRDLPASAARAAADSGARFVHFSTSYVFDGRNGPYSEDDPPNPLSVYAESKLAGEIAVSQATAGRALIVRTMGVYGDELQKKNFVYQVRQNLGSGRRMKVPNDQLGNATEAANLAGGVLALLDRRATGVWNLAGLDPNLRRSDFALQIARSYGLDESLFDFVPTSELKQPAPRPLHGGLTTVKATAATRWRPCGWSASIPDRAVAG